MQHVAKSAHIFKITDADVIDETFLLKIRNTRANTLDMSGLMNTFYRRNKKNLQKVLTEANNNPQIKTWNFQASMLHEAESILNEMLKKAKYVQELILREIFTDDKIKILDAIFTNLSLRILHLSKLDLLNDDSSEVIALSKVLNNNQRIHTVILDNCVLFPVGMSHLRKTILSHASLRTVALDFVSFRALYQVDEEELYLEDEKLEDALLPLIKEFCKICSNSHLNRIRLSHVRFTDEDGKQHLHDSEGIKFLEMITEHLTRNPFLTEAHLTAYTGCGALYNSTRMNEKN